MASPEEPTELAPRVAHAARPALDDSASFDTAPLDTAPLDTAPPHTAASSTRALVPVPIPPTTVDPEPDDADVRRSDVDEWGRSERMRALARRIYDPVYRQWFRAEWEGLENIPADGGALLVANHAAAIPSDAPVIMHGIETELGRPVYGLADNLFRKLPVVGTLWSRLGGVPGHPDNAYRLLAEQVLHDLLQLLHQLAVLSVVLVLGNSRSVCGAVEEVPFGGQEPQQVPVPGC